jgi:hypothetical protein
MMHTQVTVQILWSREMEITDTALVGQVLTGTSLLKQGRPVSVADDVQQRLTIGLGENVGN